MNRQDEENKSSKNGQENKSSKDRQENSDRENSKLLSEYMLYLVVMQPEIMYGVTDIGQTRLRDTRAEVLVVASLQTQDINCSGVAEYALKGCVKCLCWFIVVLLSPIAGCVLSLIVILFPCWIHWLKKPWNLILNFEKKSPEEKATEFFSDILKFDTSMEPIRVKGRRSKSVLFEGCRLAKKLEDELGDRKWEIMRKVWVQMLTYAAVSCRPKPLVERLSKGGELICFVWLLMAHFGLVERYQDDDRLTRTHFIIDK